MSKNIFLSRRGLLTAAAASPLAACDSARPREGFFGRMERFNEGVQRALFRPSHSVDVPHTVQNVQGDPFPSYFVSSMAPFAPAGWMLSVGGLVAQKLTLSLMDLQRMTRTDARVEHHCVEGWSAVASWHGVQLREIARIARVDARARFVEFRSFDNGYYSSWDLESALHPQTLLAYGKNGAPLPRAYGAPVRVYSPVKLGYKNVKYVIEVNFLPQASGGYWENLGYEWYGGV